MKLASYQVIEIPKSVVHKLVLDYINKETGKAFEMSSAEILNFKFHPIRESGYEVKVVEVCP